MASLMENLLDVLGNEEEQYQKLLELSIKKTPVIIKGDIAMLQAITDEEQEIVSELNGLDKNRQAIMFKIATVINKDVKTLKISQLIHLLQGQPKQQKELAMINDRLRETVENMKRVNEQNGELLNNALEMVSFDLNLLKGMKTAPETANYNQSAINTGDYYGGTIPGGFDAKQ